MAVAKQATPLYFYGHARGKPYREFSQFYPAAFQHEGHQYHCNEQWMMANKAMLMGDEASLQNIMAAAKPGQCKALGRRVSPWDQAQWDAHKYDIVVTGTRLKVLQNEDVRLTLLRTGDRPLAEASPTDRIWGIGVGVKEAEGGAPWKGENLLGKALMEVRQELKGAK